MTYAAQSIHTPFFPSSINELFSVQYMGKTFELESWQKTAILITGITGLALFGIGILFGFGLSYYFRTRLIEQIAANSSILPKLPLQTNQPKINEPKEPDLIPLEPRKPNNALPATVIATPVLQPDPVNLHSLTQINLAGCSKITDEGLKVLKGFPLPEVQPIADNPPSLTQLYLAGCSKITDEGLKVLKGFPLPEVQPIAEMELIEQRVEKVRTAIDESRKGLIALSKEYINDKVLGKWSMEGRHFISIQEGIRGYKIPDFSPLLLPKGIYCIYFTNKDDITDEWMRSDKYNQMMADEFGADNIYHLVICEHEPQWNASHVKKIHKHQLELYAEKNINDLVNQKTIQAFKKHLDDAAKT